VTQEQIREVVKITIDELTKSKLIDTNNYIIKLERVENELNKFFKGDKTNIGRILNHLSDDKYIDIIFLAYRDGKTLEWIAEYMDVEVRTIKRNKKRIVSKIYELLEG
jgi:DNA-directed RNA polymerase specialized sigma24 family protein